MLASRRSLILAFLLLFALAAGLRLWHIDHDPPPYDVLPDAAPWTDEGTIGLPAYDAASGQAPVASLIDSGGRPLQRLALYAIFKAPGIPQIDGRLASVLTGLIGLLTMAALAQSIWPGVGPLLALLIGGTGFFFVVYDRLLLTEGPLIAGMALVALLGVRARSWPAAAGVGLGIVLLAAGLKPHALALLPALLALYALRRPRLLLPLLAGLGLGYVAWRALFVAPAAPGYMGYLQQRITGEDLGLATPVEALRQILTAGMPALYLPYQIPLLLLACFEGVAFFAGPRRWLRESGDVTIVALVWLLAGLVGASLFRYLPPRYFHVASPALLLLGIAGVRRFWTGLRLPAVRRGAALALFLMVGAFLVYQIVGPLFTHGPNDRWLVLAGLPLLMVFGLAIWRAPRMSPRVRLAILACLLAVQVEMQGALYVAGVVDTRPLLAQAADGLAELPKDAVVTGRLAGTVALAAPVRGVPALDRISLSGLDQLAVDNSVYVLVLQNDEFRVDANVWPMLEAAGSFPIDYSRQQARLNVYRFRDPAMALNPHDEFPP